MYYNIGLGRIRYVDANSFLSKVGFRVRRGIHKPLRAILKVATKRNIIVESYPTLEKGKPYIFVSTHSFDEDIISCLATIDRNAYVLMGTTNQIEHNPQMYAAWANGMFYVDRQDSKSRHQAVKNMETALRSGTSVLIFAEGGYNNTENLLCMDLFASPYLLNQKTRALVVPISCFNEHNSDNIYMRFGEAMDLSKFEKREGLLNLRDSIATMVYETIEEHATPLVRSELTGDIHLQYMEERRQEYLRVKWTRDVWDEELTRYISKDVTLPEQVRTFVDGVGVNVENSDVLAPVLVKRLEDKKYNFKQYMKDNWNKTDTI